MRTWMSAPSRQGRRESPDRPRTRAYHEPQQRAGAEAFRAPVQMPPAFGRRQ